IRVLRARGMIIDSFDTWPISSKRAEVSRALISTLIRATAKLLFASSFTSFTASCLLKHLAPRAGSTRQFEGILQIEDGKKCKIAGFLGFPVSAFLLSVSQGILRHRCVARGMAMNFPSKAGTLDPLHHPKTAAAVLNVSVSWLAKAR